MVGGYNLAQKVVPEYITVYSSEGSDIVRYVASKIHEAGITIMERNRNYDITCLGIVTAVTVVGALLSRWTLNKVERHIINKRNERLRYKAYVR